MFKVTYTLLVLFFIIAGVYLLHGIYYGKGGDESSLVPECIAILYIFLLIIIKYIEEHYYIWKQTKQPIKLTKAKVIKKKYIKPIYGLETLRFPFESPTEISFYFFSSKRKFALAASVNQYKAVKKNDVVILIYQGKILHALKKDKNKPFVYNDGWASEEKLKDFLTKTDLNKI